MLAEEAKLKETTYRVKSVWKTLQGEGLFAGRPAVFVRMVGCNLWSGYVETRTRDAERTGASCPLWCDTEFTKEGSKTYTANELAEEMSTIGGAIKFCVITGGEPLLQLDAELVEAVHKQGFFIAIETNGSVRLHDSCWDESKNTLNAPDWIVCSPKLPEEQLTLEFFDELKLVLPDYMPANYASFAQKQRPNHVRNKQLPLLWLQPEDGSKLQEATQMAINLALEHPAWRVSVQTHKILNVE